MAHIAANMSACDNFRHDIVSTSQGGVGKFDHRRQLAAWLHEQGQLVRSPTATRSIIVGVGRRGIAASNASAWPGPNEILNERRSWRQNADF